MEKNKRILITTGDQDGIGPEVTLKALLQLKSTKNLFVWCSPETYVLFKKKLKNQLKFNTVAIPKDKDAFVFLSSFKNNNDELTLIESHQAPPYWVETSAKLCLKKHFYALATAPLSKTLIKSSGLKDIGHTQILARITKSKDLFMFFVGKKFSVLLVTGHIPISKVSDRMTSRLLGAAVKAAVAGLACLDKRQRGLPIRLLGLNPHAGEDGLIGHEERKVFHNIIKKFKNSKIKILGPEVPDAAFLNYKHTSIYIAPYHDQGLIPFKYAHSRDSIHLTLGLPFPRSSVDHGTAKDIFGKNKADARSMYMAIRTLQSDTGER